MHFPVNKHLVLFPNPAGDFVIAYFNTVKQGEKGNLIITDLQGRKIENILLSSEQNQQVINLKGYPNGIYIIGLLVNYKLISTEKLAKGKY